MMVKIFTTLFFCLTVLILQAQKITNPEFEQILKGNYSPSNYLQTDEPSDFYSVLYHLNDEISTDSLSSYMRKMDGFKTRHTYADTLSELTGIGATRKWAYQFFETIGKSSENTLIPSYLQFNATSACGSGSFKNIMAIQPGLNTALHNVIIIEAHIDSRCDQPCDIDCYAPGMVDNASGAALVMELARTLAKYKFNNTLVYMLTVGEEQGLLGARAMADYCEGNNVNIKAVLNNDVVGGIYCGETSSPPSCPSEGHVDSVGVRVFSDGNLNGLSRSLARTIQMQYDEKVYPCTQIATEVRLMDQEDRIGRGGDHIPFREKGVPSIRISCANEHGDGHPDSDYHDRQHTSNDVLGIDTNGDLMADSLMLNFNYLKRTAIVNANTAISLALGPEIPEFMLHDEPEGLRVQIINPQHLFYRVGVRLIGNIDFTELYRFSGNSFIIPNQTKGTYYFVSVAAEDANGLTGLFGVEQRATSDTPTDTSELKINKYYNPNCKPQPYYESDDMAVKILKIGPNPAQTEVGIDLVIFEKGEGKSNYLEVIDNLGRKIERIYIGESAGFYNITYQHKGSRGVFYLRISSDQSKGNAQRLVFY